jgi:Protein of unknown function (DUF3102)
MKLAKTSLAELAKEIREHRYAAEAAAVRVVEHAIGAGKVLIRAKAIVPHGGWLPWLAQHCDKSERTAQGYMRLAKLPEAKAQYGADLPLRDALAAISDKRLPHRCAGDEYRPHDDCELAKLEPYVAVCCGKPVRRLCACGAPYVWEDTREIAAVPRHDRLARKWVCN